MTKTCQNHLKYYQNYQNHPKQYQNLSKSSKTLPKPIKIIQNMTKTYQNHPKHIQNLSNINCRAAWLAKIGRIPKSAQDAGTEKSLYERLN